MGRWARKRRAHRPPPSRIGRLRLVIALGEGPQHTVWVTLKDQLSRPGYRDLVVSKILSRRRLAPVLEHVHSSVAAREFVEASHRRPSNGVEWHARIVRRDPGRVRAGRF